MQVKGGSENEKDFESAWTDLLIRDFAISYGLSISLLGSRLFCNWWRSSFGSFRGDLSTLATNQFCGVKLECS